jgi:hypothetical protein
MFGVLQGYLTWIKWGAIALLFVGVATFAWSMMDSYRDAITENVKLKAEIVKYDGRLASYKRMWERRQAAIDASACKVQINKWVRNPDDIPKPFEPFKNSPLSTDLPDSTKQPNAIDSEPLPPFKFPDLSKALPWNWF